MHKIQPMLFAAGIAAPVLYLATVIVGGLLTPGYSHLHQPVSALFEASAPRALSVSVAFMLYNLLLVALGIGLLMAWRHSVPLLVAAIMILINAVFGLVIELTPMDPIGALPTAAGIAHLWFAGLIVVTCAGAMAAAAVGWWTAQRAAAMATVAALTVMLVTGALAALAAEAAWPLLGLYQRLTIGGYLVWILALSLVFTRHRPG